MSVLYMRSDSLPLQYVHRHSSGLQAGDLAADNVCQADLSAGNLTPASLSP